MALQTSGAISLNDIHIEAGGTSGTQVSMNDSDVRGLIGKSSATQMSFNEWYGASSQQAFTDITAGYHFFSYTGGRGSTQYGFNTGYNSADTSCPTGSISYTDDLIISVTLPYPPYVSTSNIGDLYRAECDQNGQLRHQMIFELTNATNSNSGFTNVVFSRIGGASTTISRTAMTYSYANGRRKYVSATELDSSLIYTAGGSGTSRYCKYWGSTSGFSAGIGTDSSATGRIEFT